MTWGTQLYLNSEYKKHFSKEKLADFLFPVLSHPGCRRLMFWNTEDDAYTDLVIDICRKTDSQCWLWFPVLADSLISPEGARRAENHLGQAGMQNPGAMEMSGEGEEEFSFVCPSDSSFTEETELHMARLLDRHSYDGVFLDRIRFPSPANGLPLQFSCACPECCQRMGLDRRALTAEFESLGGEDFLDIFWSRSSGKKSFPQSRAFVERRQTLITELTGRLAAIPRSRGKGFALDLFSPSLAPAVGQDYQALSLLADWIKPMTYALAWGPAGIPLELDCLMRGMGGEFPDLSTKKIMKALENRMDHSLEPFWEKRKEDGFPLSLAFGEWEKAKSYSHDCQYYPGIEMVHSELYQTRVSPERVGDSISLFRDRAEILSCWNILDIPPAYCAMLEQG